ncbi:hypothetical protein SAMN02927903_03375, partial [Flavobacterium caeni]
MILRYIYKPSRRITAASLHCGVFRGRKFPFHEETLSSAERTQSA